jgi:hypothetical protein
MVMEFDGGLTWPLIFEAWAFVCVSTTVSCRNSRNEVGIERGGGMVAFRENDQNPSARLLDSSPVMEAQVKAS